MRSEVVQKVHTFNFLGTCRRFPATRRFPKDISSCFVHYDRQTPSRCFSIPSDLLSTTTSMIYEENISNGYSFTSPPTTQSSGFVEPISHRETYWRRDARETCILSGASSAFFRLLPPDFPDCPTLIRHHVNEPLPLGCRLFLVDSA
jgi:hypothetical protein